MNLEKLKAFFSTYDFPDEPIMLNKAEKVNNQRKFVESHIKILESQSGKIGFKPYYNRLLKYYNLINK